MAIKDRESFYGELNATGTVPNTVSRYVKVGDRSFLTVVAESGKALLDSELQLSQDAAQFASGLLNQHQAPSGWLRGQTRHDGYLDYITGQAPGGLADPNGYVDRHGFLTNAFVMPRMVAQVAGIPVVVEYTNTSTAGANIIGLEEPTVYDGTPLTVKRTDFVFLEVWKALVAPSAPAKGSLVVVANGDIDTAAPDKITIDGHDLTATAGVPAIDEFQVGVNEIATATNIATAINDPANWWATNNSVKAKAFGPAVQIQALVPGTAGNAITLSVTLTNAGCITVSGPNLTGGADRPNKPTQDSLYRHGNTQSPSATWLPDELVDQVVNQETSQRVQIQYRIRATSTAEAVNYKTHPDGFSSTSGGLATIFAQGATGGPVADYPFVPANRTDVLLNSSAVAYDVDDPGLWIAGDGTAASVNDLGTVDGFVYAIPICFVHRHNDASSGMAGLLGFNPDTNTNGAPLVDHPGFVNTLGIAVPAGVSDRPDKHFADLIDQDNLLDLRRHVIFPGIDTSAELQFQIQSLLDGTTRTWSVDTADKEILGNGSGDVSTRFLVCNEIGRSDLTHGGIGNLTTRGTFIREFDHIARRFGDQAVVERFVMAFYPGDRDTASGPAVAPGLVNDGKYVIKSMGSDPARWNVNDILRLDLRNLDGTTLGGLFQGLDGGGTSALAPIPISDLMPPGTAITDVLLMYHDDGNTAGAIDQSVRPAAILGLGTTCVDIVLDQNLLVADGGQGLPGYYLVDNGGMSGSDRRIFVEFEVTYPIGVGTTDTVYQPLTPDPNVYDFTNGVGPGPVIAENTTQQPNDMELLLPPRFREGFREVQLEYVANDTVGHGAGDRNAGSAVGSVHDEYIVSADAHTLYFPRRVFRDDAKTEVFEMGPAVARNIDTIHTEWGSSTRKVSLLNALSCDQSLCKIRYFPQDAIPNYGNEGYQVGVYFRSHAPQTAGISDLPQGTSEGGVMPTTLRVEPLFMDNNLWTNQIGSGSQERGFPYLAPMDQIPLNDLGMGTTKEWFFCATADVTISDFNANTGFLTLPTYVQADGQNVVEFGGLGATQKPTKDADFRAYYPFARDDVYRPTVMSQPLFGAVRHKVMFPFLARSTEEVKGADGGLLFRKNELLLIVLSRTVELSPENKVVFTDPVDNTTAAGVYRTRNLLLLVGR